MILFQRKIRFPQLVRLQRGRAGRHPLEGVIAKSAAGPGGGDEPLFDANHLLGIGLGSVFAVDALPGDLFSK